MTRRTRLIALAALSAFVLFVLVPYYRSRQALKSDDDDNESQPGFDKYNTNTSDGSRRLCDDDTCFKGSWKPRRNPYKTIDELRPWSGCPSAARGNGVETEAEMKAASEKRLLELMNWVWMPEHGAVLSKWNPEAFVIRLLSSPGGLIFVGDDISKEHFEALVILLNNGGFALETASTASQLYQDKYVQQYVLKSGDSATIKRLVELSGVPESRVKRPILTLIQDSLLINDADLMTISHRLGTKGEHHWTTKLPRVQKWPAIVEDMANNIGDDGEVAYREDTILVLNTGIHWSREELTLLKTRNNPIAEQNYLTEAYRQMLRVVSEELKPISRLSVYYRSTAPGHPKCYTRTSPYKSTQQADILEKNVISRLLQGITTEQERLQKRRSDWDLFGVHNDLWRRAIVRLEQERTQLLAKPYPYTKYFAKWHFMDIWSQALQRPDAHFDPLQDCLRWCPPVLFDQWTRHLYHALQLEKAENKSIPSTGQLSA